MSIFQREETAWSAWTKAIEEFTGDPGSPLIVQSPTIMRPLSVQKEVNPKLAWYRKYLVADTIPFYGNRNPNAYVSGAANLVSLGYSQYLNELNREVIDRFVNQADAQNIRQAMKRYSAAQAAMTSFRRDANADWKRRKLADPGLSREAWEEAYGAMGYRPQLNLLEGEVRRTYGEYKRLSSPYPQVTRVAQALARMDTGAGTQIALPTSEDDLTLGQEGWDTFYKTNLDLGEDWTRFFEKDVIDTREINQHSVQSSYYNHSWSGGGSISYGFFSVSGGASGGTLETHLATGTQSVRFAFKRLALGTVVRGSWFDAGLINSLPYYGYVDPSAYWGPSGTLNLVPISLIIGRSPTIEIATSSTAVDTYKNWRKSGGSLGFGIGSFRIGGGGSSSTEWGSTSDTSSGSMIRIEDTSNQAYVVGVILAKMDEVTSTHAAMMSEADADYSQFLLEEKQRVAERPVLML